MSDTFSAYKRGVTKLMGRMGRNHPRLSDALVYQHRLIENIEQAQRYGDTETRRADRAQIIDSLNQLALETVEFTFNELCRVDLQPDAAVIPLPVTNTNYHRGTTNLGQSSGSPSKTSDRSTMLQVLPLDDVLPACEPPPYLTIYTGYRYLGQWDGSDSEHLYREQDGHVVLLFTGVPGVIKPFLIDKYAITNRQFSDCLNALLQQGTVRKEETSTSTVRQCVDVNGRPLVFDALDRWRRGPTASELWLHKSDPWGVAYQDGQWRPVPGSELLPATLVTWWGARLYSLWANQVDLNALDEKLAYLPTTEQWQMAALWHFSSRRRQRYPWGESWRRELSNYAGYWANHDVHEADWSQRWASQPEIYRRTRPLPVASLSEGCSPLGCVQMLGNVWEWCANAPTGTWSGVKAVKGGACLSPQEHCSPTWEVTWRPEQGNEYIGFRCCLPVVE